MFGLAWSALMEIQSFLAPRIQGYDRGRCLKLQVESVEADGEECIMTVSRMSVPP